MNEQNQQAACCGNCRYAQDAPEDAQHVECHGAPPSAALVPTRGEFTLDQGEASLLRFQRVSVWPIVLRSWWCARHEPAEDDGE